MIGHCEIHVYVNDDVETNVVLQRYHISLSHALTGSHSLPLAHSQGIQSRMLETVFLQSVTIIPTGGPGGTFRKTLAGFIRKGPDATFDFVNVGNRCASFGFLPS
jgi:hypothetical protein